MTDKTVQTLEQKCASLVDPGECSKMTILRKIGYVVFTFIVSIWQWWATKSSISEEETEVSANILLTFSFYPAQKSSCQHRSPPMAPLQLWGPRRGVLAPPLLREEGAEERRSGGAEERRSGDSTAADGVDGILAEETDEIHVSGVVGTPHESLVCLHWGSFPIKIFQQDFDFFHSFLDFVGNYPLRQLTYFLPRHKWSRVASTASQ